jgi:hypothetical protein
MIDSSHTLTLTLIPTVKRANASMHKKHLNRVGKVMNRHHSTEVLRSIA